MFKKLILIASLLMAPVLLNAQERGDIDFLGADGMHKPAWLNITQFDLRQDLADAQAQGKRLALIVEQRGCIYCKIMHEEIFPIPAINTLLVNDFYFVQLNMFGDLNVTDFDGEVLSERDFVSKWGVFFTPTILFIADEVGESQDAAEAVVAVMPGAFGEFLTLNMLNWILLKGYNSDERFQNYHARMQLTQLDN